MDLCGGVVTCDRFTRGKKSVFQESGGKKIQRHENETFKFIIPYV